MRYVILIALAVVLVYCASFGFLLIWATLCFMDYSWYISLGAAYTFLISFIFLLAEMLKREKVFPTKPIAIRESTITEYVRRLEEKSKEAK